jgi:hypothetical protein
MSVHLDSNRPLNAGEVVNPFKLFERVSFATSSEDQAAFRKTARDWKLSDVEAFLEVNDLCLLIDDFEKAPDALVQIIADMCKRLTIKFVPKCIIIGTGETFARLYHADEGLDGRLAELSLASFGNQREVWNYINDGLELLEFDTPRAMLKTKLITREEASQTERAFYEAADGMPKYINELAMRICQRVLGEGNAPPQRVRVSVKDALGESAQMLDENMSRCAQQVRKVEKNLRDSVELRMVLKSIFHLGANAVHRVSDLVAFIERTVDPDFSYEQFMSGLERLKKLGLYVQTGKSGEVLFAKEPMFAHVLGLICDDPPRYRKDNDVFGLFGQRSLPLLS